MGMGIGKDMGTDAIDGVVVVSGCRFGVVGLLNTPTLRVLCLAYILGVPATCKNRALMRWAHSKRCDRSNLYDWLVLNFAE